ncbi:MAG: histidinol dehydrogenase [Ruminococcaceae bacterium]|nr:histidinol dehydrogenase [Oscillospiraceae bacterium]
MISIYKYGDVPNSEIYKRENISQNVEGTVKEIIDNVIKNGDRALFEYCEKFDKVKLSTLEVTPEEIDEAFSSVEKKFIDVLKESAENIRNFHKRQVANSFFINEKDGVVTGQRVTPIEKVGLYVPGGTAAYPSTVLMDSIPAKIAGCKEIVMVTPPMTSGKVNPVILAAAKIAGVDRIFKVGGAQAVAALAYGTDTVPKVDKIVGPGNAYVAEAKKQVFGKVSIDMIAGPSEILVVADRTSIPKNIAADMLSQAEHDKMASAVLVCDSFEFAKKVSEELERQIPLLPRADIARQSIDNNGKIIVAEDNLLLAIDIANAIAPEHLELSVDNPFDYLDKVHHAGSIFMGKYCPEALGDYFAGPNHTLPTSGTARFSSPLSVDDFVKKSQIIYYTKDALDKVESKVAYFARKEGLDAHARSVEVRGEK